MKGVLFWVGKLYWGYFMFLLTFKKLNFETFAAGDSYNDLSMIETADQKALFCPPERLIQERPDLKVARTHAELRACIEAALQIS